MSTSIGSGLTSAGVGTANAAAGAGAEAADWSCSSGDGGCALLLARNDVLSDAGICAVVFSCASGLDAFGVESLLTTHHLGLNSVAQVQHFFSDLTLRP